MIYFRHLRDFRDAVREGLRDGVSDRDAEREYARHVRVVKEKFGRCRDAMRADINPRGSRQRWRG